MLNSKDISIGIKESYTFGTYHIKTNLAWIESGLKDERVGSNILPSTLNSCFTATVETSVVRICSAIIDKIRKYLWYSIHYYTRSK